MTGTMKRHTDSNDRKILQTEKGLTHRQQKQAAFGVSKPDYINLCVRTRLVFAQSTKHITLALSFYTSSTAWDTTDTSTNVYRTEHICCPALWQPARQSSQCWRSEAGSLNHSRDLQSSPLFQLSMCFSSTLELCCLFFPPLTLLSFTHFFLELPSFHSLSSHPLYCSALLSAANC